MEIEKVVDNGHGGGHRYLTNDKLDCESWAMS